MDPKITLSDILQWERLQGKSFLQFESGNIDDISTLMYVHDHSNKRKYTKDFYCKFFREQFEDGGIATKKEIRDFLRLVEQDLQFVNQFSEHKESTNEHALETPSKLTEAIMSILFSGVDPQWLMTQGLDMLPVLTEGLADKIHQQQETYRFWAQLLISPHVKKSALDKLRKSLTFEWEKKKKGLDKITQSDVNLAHAIFGTKK